MQAQTIEGPVKLEFKQSRFNFAPIWKPWQTEGAFPSLKSAELYVYKRTKRDYVACGIRPNFSSKVVRLDGSVRLTFGIMPLSEFEHGRLAEGYSHFRIKRLSTEELNGWLIDSANRREYENVKLALASGAVVSEITLEHIISSWASEELKKLIEYSKQIKKETGQ